MLSVAAFQGKMKQGDTKYNFDKVIQQLEIAEAKGIDILCMPESFLHGYFKLREEAKKFSLDLESSIYTRMLEQLRDYKTTLLLGINERKSDCIYNTVVVIENGEHLGQYRKAYTYPPYDYFALGKEFPVFEKKGVRYGIIICLDSAYREPARILALKGAQILFCPMFNRVENNAKMLNYLNQKSHFITRAFDNECWFISSDIVWEDDGNQVCAGYSTILDKNGEIVSRSLPFTEMLIEYSIPLDHLRNEAPVEGHYRRFSGDPRLRNIIHAMENNERN